MMFGALFMTVFALANALDAAPPVIGTLACCVARGRAVRMECAGAGACDRAGPAAGGRFRRRAVLGVPIGFVLAFSALLCFLADPTLPLLVYSQQVMAGADHFVLLAVPFFVLAGLLMESNGMSARLVELLLRIFGRVRGGPGLIVILATACFSGVSGQARRHRGSRRRRDAGGAPCARRSRRNGRALACSAVMAETIPPCVNMIIMGFVANISIAGLFVAGIVPAAVLAASLAVVTVITGRRIDVSAVFTERRAWLPLAAARWLRW